MKGGGRRKSVCSDLPPPFNPFRNEIVDEVIEQQPTNDGENGGDDGNEEENADYDGNSGGQADGGENNGNEERPKLAEGFYEIEALLKKRIRKGVKQYLIKWRGWPDSANTWEPAESFTSCPEVIKAFESMSSGKRKRKRKHSAGPVSQSKKKQQQQQDSSVGIKVEESCSGLYVNKSKVTENNVDGTSHNGIANQLNGLDNKISEVKATSPVNEENMTEFAIHIQQDPAEPLNGDKVVGTEVLRASPRIGARRRKSLAVKRFKKELNSIPKHDLIKKATAASDAVVEDDIRNADDVVNGLDSEHILDTPQSVSVITKIIKAVNYSISVLNDAEEVHVSFLVMRSDGEEIVVDNKYLKKNNPNMLINFYEQHLRYTSPSE